MTLDWRKIASITTGGKPNFYRLYDANGRWLASIVWNSQVRAYAVEVAKPLANGITTGTLLEYASTVPQAKRIVSDWMASR